MPNPDPPVSITAIEEYEAAVTSLAHIEANTPGLTAAIDDARGRVYRAREVLAIALAPIHAEGLVGAQARGRAAVHEFEDAVRADVFRDFARQEEAKAISNRLFVTRNVVLELVTRPILVGANPTSTRVEWAMRGAHGTIGTRKR